MIVSFYSIAWFGNHTSELHKPPLKVGLVETSERKLKRIAVVTYYIQLPHVTGGVQCCCFQFLGLFIMACPKTFVCLCVCVCVCVCV